MRGSPGNACAIATRCRFPPDNVASGSLATTTRSGDTSSSSIRARRARVELLQSGNLREELAGVEMRIDAGSLRQIAEDASKSFRTSAS
jgi:hypothetical protein